MAQQHSNLEPKATRDQALQQRWRTAQHHQLMIKAMMTHQHHRKALAKTPSSTLIPTLLRNKWHCQNLVWYRKEARPAIIKIFIGAASLPQMN